MWNLKSIKSKIYIYIVEQFLSGKNPNQIAKHLIENKIPTPREKEKWSYSSVKSILTYEKYKGDALLQKYYVADFLNKTQKRNNGELPQYYVENSHEAIIDKEVFDSVQVQLSENKKMVYREKLLWKNQVWMLWQFIRKTFMELN